jgi:hypothetical protein
MPRTNRRFQHSSPLVDPKRSSAPWLPQGPRQEIAQPGPLERDDDSEKSHLALRLVLGPPSSRHRTLLELAEHVAQRVRLCRRYSSNLLLDHDRVGDRLVFDFIVDPASAQDLSHDISPLERQAALPHALPEALDVLTACLVPVGEECVLQVRKTSKVGKQRLRCQRLLLPQQLLRSVAPFSLGGTKLDPDVDGFSERAGTRQVLGTGPLGFTAATRIEACLPTLHERDGSPGSHRRGARVRRGLRLISYRRRPPWPPLCGWHAPLGRQMSAP